MASTLLKLPSNPARKRILLAMALLALLMAGLLAYGKVGRKDVAAEKPVLMVMSSIPLQWGEADMAQIASGSAKPSPLFEHLSRRNRVRLIDDFQKIGEPGVAPLLMIQPRALAPRELVELDGWIRRGGRAIIFADPVLDWHSSLPLGDQRRPLFTSLLTPLFRHWGLELAVPVDEDSGEKRVQVGEFLLAPTSAGIWLDGDGKPAARCTIRADQLIAYCAVDKGQALLVADADMLHEEHWTDGMMTAGTKGWLDSVIAKSRRREVLPETLWEKAGN